MEINGFESDWDGFTSGEKAMFQKCVRILLKKTFVVYDKDEEGKKEFPFTLGQNQYDFIDYVVGNDEKLNMAKVIENKVKICVSDIMERREFTYVPITDTSKTRASLKIQDGCNNRCSYCIIPFARGNSRSAKSDFIIEQINNLVEKGYSEIVFTGIHIGLWGNEFGMTLLDLLKAVEAKTQLKRYRLDHLNSPDRVYAVYALQTVQGSE